MAQQRLGIVDCFLKHSAPKAEKQFETSELDPENAWQLLLAVAIGSYY
jgi:hypothetical protein